MYRNGNRFKGYFKKRSSVLNRPSRTFYGQREPGILERLPNDIWYKTNNEHIPTGIYIYSNGLWREHNPVGMLKEHRTFELIEPDYSKLKCSIVSASKIKASTLF